MLDKKKRTIGRIKCGRLLAACLTFALALGGCAGKDTEEIADAERTDTLEEGASDSADEAKAESAEPAITFEGKDMEGNTVSSDILGESKLTMINVWATYCNPCLSEMPDLGELAGEYDSEEFQLIGIISDVQEGADQEIMKEAQSLIEMTGADYTHLLLNKSIYDALLTEVTGVPTTFFLDQEGNLLGAYLGAASKEKWKERIDGFLEEL